MDRIVLLKADLDVVAILMLNLQYFYCQLFLMQLNLCLMGV